MFDVVEDIQLGWRRAGGGEALGAPGTMTPSTAWGEQALGRERWRPVLRRLGKQGRSVLDTSLYGQSAQGGAVSLSEGLVVRRARVGATAHSVYPALLPVKRAEERPRENIWGAVRALSLYER
ncbi:hypothetical protein SKAU_G00379760 [Synaphobranchus kaupii]|uniref:Uncharacterized protein n=1 Tax=Synaphobranchus kaupii TaxID=118154 RepID=A0A9Q1EDF1_SYNKA|nr:hypothetical protein SKAU_G00379760 [Synaphobranchus kaupii]